MGRGSQQVVSGHGYLLAPWHGEIFRHSRDSRSCFAGLIDAKHLARSARNLNAVRPAKQVQILLGMDRLGASGVAFDFYKIWLLGMVVYFLYREIDAVWDLNGLPSRLFTYTWDALFSRDGGEYDDMEGKKKETEMVDIKSGKGVESKSGAPPPLPRRLVREGSALHRKGSVWI